MKPIFVKSFYHQDTSSWSHLVCCEKTKTAVIIDPVLDFEASSAKVSSTFIDDLVNYVQANKLKIKYILETHAHADHLTAAAFLTKKFNSTLAIGEKIVAVQKTFQSIYNLKHEFKCNGSQFDRLLSDGEILNFGDKQIQCMHTPGHTDDSMSFMIDEAIFIGDTLFAPDYGTARCDFPGGDAGKLYDSIQNIFSLGEDKKLYLCHDYPPIGRQPQAWFSAAEQKQSNIHLQGTSKETFVAMRNARDAKLKPPKLIIPAIQVNIRAGQFPLAEDNGRIYLKIPLKMEYSL